MQLWKHLKQNVVVLYQLRKSKKMKKTIPEMPENTNGVHNPSAS